MCVCNTEVLYEFSDEEVEEWSAEALELSVVYLGDGLPFSTMNYDKKGSGWEIADAKFISSQHIHVKRLLLNAVSDIWHV